MLTWLGKNKVLLFGLAGAIAIALQQFLGSATIDYKVIGLSVVIAASGFLGRNLQGQAMAIVGALGSAAATILTSIQSGNKLSWVQVALTAIFSLLTALGQKAQPVATTTATTKP